MTKEEYEAEKLVINKEFDAKLNALNKEYALSNNPYKIGDVISDHYHTIKIERIVAGKCGDFIGLPCCKYYGVELRKDGKSKKRQGDTVIFQENIEEKK